MHSRKGVRPARPGPPGRSSATFRTRPNTTPEIRRHEMECPPGWLRAARAATHLLSFSSFFLIVGGFYSEVALRNEKKSRSAD